MIRILIADDHAMVRNGLDQLLNSVADFSVIGHARDGIEAIYLCEMLHPDVVLMDITMPRMDGLTATQILRQRNTWTKFIVLSALGDETLLQKAIETGVEVVLSKDASNKEIVDAVYTVSKTG